MKTVETNLQINGKNLFVTTNGIKLGGKGKVLREPELINQTLKPLTNGERRKVRREM